MNGKRPGALRVSYAQKLIEVMIGHTLGFRERAKSLMGHCVWKLLTDRVINLGTVDVNGNHRLC